MTKDQMIKSLEVAIATLRAMGVVEEFVGSVDEGGYSDDAKIITSFDLIIREEDGICDITVEIGYGGD
jgi:hypothetical protein